jgi:glycerate 2-kinase
MRHLLESSFHHALKYTSPKRLVQKNLVQKHLPKEKPSLILAVGKAALPMLEGALEVFPGVPYLVTPPQEEEEEKGRQGEGEIKRSLLPSPSSLLSATHPIPSLHSVAAAEKALELVSRLSSNDLLLVLVSGGGSSLWCAPWGIELEEKQALTQVLLRSGADIQELNTVRKHLSSIKGGRLVQATKARVFALLLSDVVGDDMAVIASGPTVADPSTFADALEVLNRYQLDFPNVREHFQKGIWGEISESPKPEDAVFTRVQNKIIGSNHILLKAAREYLIDQGYKTMILSDRFTGDTKELARFHAAIIQSIRKHKTPFAPPVVLLSGGETTVTVKGQGKGGRNQEFALWLLNFLEGRLRSNFVQSSHYDLEVASRYDLEVASRYNKMASDIWALSAGSDGIDGNSTAAGAFLTPDSYQRAKVQGLDIEKFLTNNDSSSFFKALGDTLETGPTQHNLNDFRAIMVL